MGSSSLQTIWDEVYRDARMCRGLSKRAAREAANVAPGRWLRGAYRPPRRIRRRG